jgi:hypothetical protein
MAYAIVGLNRGRPKWVPSMAYERAVEDYRRESNFYMLSFMLIVKLYHYSSYDHLSIFEYLNNP